MSHLVPDELEPGYLESARRSGGWEHAELIRYQVKNVFTGEEQSYGKGRSLEVVFACYCPEGSGAADLAARAIRQALEELREVARLPEGERSKFGFRYGMKSALIKLRGPVACYRPPEGAVPYRRKPREGLSACCPTSRASLYE